MQHQHPIGENRPAHALPHALASQPHCRTAAAPHETPRAAPNLALATLWADQLSGAGIDASVQRAYAGSIAGEIPPDQALPEVWVMDDAGMPRR